LALPVTAGQILWVNTVTAVTLALALAFEPGEAAVMQHPPRAARAPLISGALAFRMAYVSVLMVAVTFAVFQWELARGHTLEQARTASVNMLAL
ncbi:cation transporting ATPase C-terminal domain-containing protein, partial [Acinetobacter baumannii]|uniref:cation transporting ATPase C-terminal domain-containing protein n=1 Tax=Acinetobacter baumannii TaxID=470 RepID=UPI00332D072A